VGDSLTIPVQPSPCRRAQSRYLVRRGNVTPEMWIVGPYSVAAGAEFRDDQHYSGQYSVKKWARALNCQEQGHIREGKPRPAMNHLGARMTDYGPLKLSTNKLWTICPRPPPPSSSITITNNRFCPTKATSEDHHGGSERTDIRRLCTAPAAPQALCVTGGKKNSHHRTRGPRGMVLGIGSTSNCYTLWLSTASFSSCL
jgi:hypothetical protein